MKNLILIIGTLIGLSVGVSAQNTEQESMDSLYFSPPTTEEDEIVLFNTFDDYLTKTANEEPQKFPNQPVSLIFDKIDKIHPKVPLNEKIKGFVLSLNDFSSSKDISILIDSLYGLSVEGNNMCFLSCDDSPCDLNRRLVYNQLEETLLNDLLHKEIQVSVHNELVLGPMLGCDDNYMLTLDISIDGSIRSFTLDIINRKIRNIDYCGSQVTTRK